MKNEPLRRISVATPLEAEDAVAELLAAIFNCSASSYFDVKTQTSAVSVCISERQFRSRDIREEISAGLRRIKNCGLKIGSGRISISKLRREDWAESWKRHFKPIEIGGKLLIKPSWIKRRPRKNQAVVALDPGLSFGTGHHPTTSFCLRQIVAAVCNAGAVRRQSSRSPDATMSFLDIGAGSGILAIAAAKLGYKTVCAIDVDPEAVRTARANARANGVLRKIKIVRGDATKFSAKPKEAFDLVCANLTSDLLIAERKKIIGPLRPGGTLVLAGILKPEFLEVQRAFENCGLKLISSKSEKGWRSGLFCFA
jgi:ribosomal protein L11 methyltransferase